MVTNVMAKKVSADGRNSKMEQIETEAMINSLSQLQGYYQSRYEHYLAMATEAKEHRERVSLLLQDLLAPSSHEENYVMEKPQNNESIEATSLDNARVAPPEAVNLSPLLSSAFSAELSSDRARIVEEDSFGALDVKQMKKFLDSLSQAMSVIESISNSDSGKTLHQSYLHKMLNLELSQELSVDLVELYLESAITRGYLKLDEFDSSCYIAQGYNSPSNSMTDLPKKSQKSAECTPLATGNALPVGQGLANRKPYDLPPSNKLKPTLLETIRLFIAECIPTRFSIEDVINYLYPQPQQSAWSQSTKNKVRSSISNVLSRKIYLGKQWQRIRPGIYQPL
jgi:hypothetical protein